MLVAVILEELILVALIPVVPILVMLILAALTPGICKD